MKETAFILGLVVFFVVVCAALLMGAIFYVDQRGSLPSDLAQIEQLRSDAAGIDPSQAEDVIGQVTVWNQRIASQQALNRTWYAGFIIPDEWDAIEPIEVPR